MTKFEVQMNHELAMTRARNTAIDERDEIQRRAQAFFASLAAEVRRPSYGVMQRDFAIELLKRAQEAKLYEPEPA